MKIVKHLTTIGQIRNFFRNESEFKLQIGNRNIYKIEKKNIGFWFISSVDSKTGFSQYLGIIARSKYRLTAKSKFKYDSEEHQVFAQWFGAFSPSLSDEEQIKFVTNHVFLEDYTPSGAFF